MFSENNNGANQNAQQGQTVEETQETFLEIGEDDEDVLKFDLDYQDYSENNQEQNNSQESSQSQENEQDQEQNEGSEELVFEESQSSNEDEDEEKLIERLQAKGFDVTKREVTSQEAIFRQNQQRLSQTVSDIEAAIKQPDDVLIRSKMKGDLEDSYKKEGKGHLINTLDFQEELEATFNDMNSSMKGMYVGMIRQNLSAHLAQKKTELTALETKENNRIDKIISTNKENLSKALNEIRKNGNFLGIPITDETLKSAYSDIVSGKLNSEYNNNQEVVAEFAIYLKNREAIKASLTGATYGEGVKKAVDAIQNGQQPGTKSSLSTLIQTAEKTGTGNGSASNFSDHWSSNESEPEKEEKPKIVAGVGRI